MVEFTESVVARGWACSRWAARPHTAHGSPGWRGQPHTRTPFVRVWDRAATRGWELKAAVAAGVLERRCRKGSNEGLAEAAAAVLDVLDGQNDVQQN